MTFSFRASTPSGPARGPVTRTVRKIALCGSHSSSLEDAPWHDPSWEFWGHASSRGWYQRPMDRYFDLHPRACWTRGGKKGAKYPQWLAKQTTPIYMQERYPEVPASVKYPRGQILLEFGHVPPFFGNQVAWMIALALTEGVSTIGLFGVNYSTQGEYERQRGSAIFWLGIAAGMGVRLILPEQCTLLSDPKPLYGYESHDEMTGALLPAYQPKKWKPAETIRPVQPGETPKLAEPPADIKAQIEAEEAEFPRPAWALRPVTNRTDGRASV